MSVANARESIRVLVADSTRMAVQLLSNAVERDRRCRVIDSVVTCSDAVRVVGREPIDVALIGTELDHTPHRGFDAVQQLHSFSSATKSIMLLDVTRPEFVVSAFRAGARGVFCRDESLDKLGHCIRSVHAGQIWANSEQLNHALNALSSGMLPETFAGGGSALLSEREQQVVRCVAEGFSNREIAERLKLSEHTIKNYLFRIFDKLGLSSRIEVALYAFSRRESIKGNGRAGGRELSAVELQAPSLEWTMKAAEQGLGPAQYLLGEMYRTGNGVPRDMARAYIWFARAEQTCATLSERSRAIRSKLALKLSAEELSQVQARMIDGKKHPPKSVLSEDDAKLADEA